MRTTPVPNGEIDDRSLIAHRREGPRYEEDPGTPARSGRGRRQLWRRRRVILDDGDIVDDLHDRGDDNRHDRVIDHDDQPIDDDRLDEHGTDDIDIDIDIDIGTDDIDIDIDHVGRSGRGGVLQHRRRQRLQ